MDVGVDKKQRIVALCDPWYVCCVVGVAGFQRTRDPLISGPDLDHLATCNIFIAKTYPESTTCDFVVLINKYSTYI